MNIRLFTELALSEEHVLNVDACKRVRYRQSECQICSDICPEQAIKLDLGPLINDSCSRCGLCVNACPTEVFQSEIDLDSYWLDQIQEFINKEAADGHDKSLVFHCQFAQTAKENSIAVNCVGNLNENLLLGISLMGLKSIVIHTGDCTGCDLSKAVMLFNESFNHARAITQLVNIDGLTVKQLTRPKKDKEDIKLSRRAFFSRISSRVKEKTLPADYTRVDPLKALLNYQEDRKDSEKQISQRRQGLRKLLGVGANNIDYHHKNPEVGHWHKMRVEEEKCVGCAICVNVCPTGALVKKIKGNYLYRYFTSAHCTNCGLCQEACPEQIIHFEKRYKLSDILEAKPELVARVELTGCQICGETIPTIEGVICTTCLKRQVSPLFLD